MTNNNNPTKGNTMINLGTANGWALTGTPKEYTKHVAECGTEYETTICYMEYPAEGTAIKRQRQEVKRKYDMIVIRKGNCYHNHTCKELSLIHI